MGMTSAIRSPVARVLWLYFFPLLTVSASILSCSAANDRPPQGVDIRNVILISVDTCRADHLSCYGYSLKTTPALDAVAADGVMFTHVQSTNPITFPAHCSMLTGTIPPFHGVRGNFNYRLDDASVTLAEVLRDHDFQTAAFVGAFPLHSSFGLAQGFDTYGDQFGVAAGEEAYNERKAEAVSREAIAWLEEQRQRPFFLFLHYFDPHGPYEAPEPFASKYAKNPYAAEIGYTDYWVGQVIEKLKTLGLYDSSLIIIAGDHGEGLHEHKEAEHGFFIYQSTIRVPLIIRSPGWSTGRQVDDTVSLIDIVPTVLGLLDLSPPPQVQGVDLADYLFGRPGPKEERAVYCESIWPMMYGCCPLRGIINDRWHYVWSIKPELYDLRVDAAEMNNLIDEHPQKARELHNRLEEMLASDGRAIGDQVTVAPDQDTVARLRSLGYVGGGVVVEELDFRPGMDDPKDFIHLYNRIWKADRYYKQNRPGLAKAECLAILDQRPEIPSVHAMLGDIAFDQGRLDDAFTHFSNVLSVIDELTGDSSRSSVRFDYEMVDAHINLGYVLFKQGNLAGAADQFERVLRIRPDVPEALNNLGVVLQAQGRVDEAIDHYRQVLSINPHDARGHSNLAGALVKKGELSAAIDHYRQALRLNPNHESVRRKLARAVAMRNAAEPE